MSFNGLILVTLPFISPSLLGWGIPRFLTRNEEFVYEEFLTRKTYEKNEEFTSLKRNKKIVKYVTFQWISKYFFKKFNIWKKLMHKNSIKMAWGAIFFVWKFWWCISIQWTSKIWHCHLCYYFLIKIICVDLGNKLII